MARRTISRLRYPIIATVSVCVVLCCAILADCKEKRSDDSTLAHTDASQDTVPKIVVDSVTASPGATDVQVPVKVVNNPGIAGATIEFTFDSGLVLKNTVNGSALEDMDFSKSESVSSPFRCSWDSLDGEITEDGSLVILTFGVSESAKMTDSFNINISYRDGDIYDDEWVDLKFETVNGGITIG